MIISRNRLNSTGESRQPCLTPTVVWNSSPSWLVRRNCTAGVFIKGLDDLNKPFLDVEASEDMPEAIMPHSVEGFLEVNEVVEQVLLML